jgi:hypothetical protein
MDFMTTVIITFIKLFRCPGFACCHTSAIFLPRNTPYLPAAIEFKHILHRSPREPPISFRDIMSRFHTWRFLVLCYFSSICLPRLELETSRLLVTRLYSKWCSLFHPSHQGNVRISPYGKRVDTLQSPSPALSFPSPEELSAIVKESRFALSWNC